MLQVYSRLTDDELGVPCRGGDGAPGWLFAGEYCRAVDMAISASAAALRAASCACSAFVRALTILHHIRFNETGVMFLIFTSHYIGIVFHF